MGRNPTAKNLLTNSVVNLVSNSIFNPLKSTNELLFPLVTVAKVRDVLFKYSDNLAKRKYSSIPTDYLKYVRLLMSIRSYNKTVSNSNLNVILNIVEDALIGSVNASVLYYENLRLTAELAVLNKQIKDILEGKNNVSAVAAKTTGSFEFKRTIKLAPLFSFYILLFGLPEFGVGFDPIRVEILEEILLKHNIQPYGTKNTASSAPAASAV